MYLKQRENEQVDSNEYDNFRKTFMDNLKKDLDKYT